MKAKELTEQELESICGGLRVRQGTATMPAPGGPIGIGFMSWVVTSQLPKPYQIKK